MTSWSECPRDLFGDVFRNGFGTAVPMNGSVFLAPPGDSKADTKDAKKDAHGIKRKFFLDDSAGDFKSEKKCRIDPISDTSCILDFRDKSGDHVECSDLVIIASIGGVEFNFHRTRIMMSDIEVMKSSIRVLQMTPDKKAEITVEADPATVSIVLDFVFGNPDAIRKENSIEKLANVMRFAFRYTSQSISTATLKRIESLPVPWNWGEIENMCTMCKIPIQPLAAKWLSLAAEKPKIGPVSPENSQLSSVVCRACLNVPLEFPMIPVIIRYALPPISSVYDGWVTRYVNNLTQTISSHRSKFTKDLNNAIIAALGKTAATIYSQGILIGLASKHLTP